MSCLAVVAGSSIGGGALILLISACCICCCVCLCLRRKRATRRAEHEQSAYFYVDNNETPAAVGNEYVTQKNAANLEKADITAENVAETRKESSSDPMYDAIDASKTFRIGLHQQDAKVNKEEPVTIVISEYTEVRKVNGNTSTSTDYANISEPSTEDPHAPGDSQDQANLTKTVLDPEGKEVVYTVPNKGKKGTTVDTAPNDEMTAKITSSPDTYEKQGDSTTSAADLINGLHNSKAGLHNTSEGLYLNILSTSPNIEDEIVTKT